MNINLNDWFNLVETAIMHLDENLADVSKWVGYEECKKEHIQLRKWLIELKELKEKELKEKELKETKEKM